MAKEAVWALGTMSGTSLDGVDAAMIQTDGHRVMGFGPTGFRPYSAAEQAVLRRALGQWPGDPDVTAAALVVEAAHLEVLRRFTGAEVLGFHGQTLAHAPGTRGTHQCGNGAALADGLGLPTVWDFRSTDVAQGGQGAPLVPFYHFALARFIDVTQPIAFLNLGGVANLTWIDPTAPGPETDGALLAFDTGPANAPINDLTLARLGQPQDHGGKLAAQGRVDEGFVTDVLTHPWFDQLPPKSLDRDAFRTLFHRLDSRTDADAAANLTALAAAAVARAMRHFPAPVTRILATGGGRHNPTLMAELRRRIPVPIDPVESVGLDGDMIEAQAFAFLAVRVLNDLPTTAPGTTGVPRLTTGGRISRPSASVARPESAANRSPAPPRSG